VENLRIYSPVLRQTPWENYYLKDTDKGPLVWRAKAHRFHLACPWQRRHAWAALAELWLIVPRTR